MLYDADCGFCRWSVVWVITRARGRALAASAIQSELGAELLRDLTPAQRLRSAHAVYPDGRRVSGGAAALAALAHVPATRPLARLGAYVPGIAQAAYAALAAHRASVGLLVSAGARTRADRRLAQLTIATASELAALSL